MDEIPQLVTELEDTLQIEKIPITTTTSKPYSLTPTTLSKKIPITIITGYLGSGKSTLLDRIGKTSNKRLAIILNEFGDSSIIEKSVTIQDTNESVTEWLDIGNGCLCCTVKDNGVLAIENLIENSKDKIDYILLETTGIADPAPIAKMFWLDEGLASNIYIDGVITVVDSEHIVKCLDDIGGHWHKQQKLLASQQQQQQPEGELTPEEIEMEQKHLQEGITTAHLQLALADTILLNKIDKIESGDEVQDIIERIRRINETSPIYTTSFGDIDLSKILDLHAFEANDSKFLESIHIKHKHTFHDDRIGTICIDFPFFNNREDFNKFEMFLQYILWENKINNKPVEIHRIKGLLVLKDGTTDVRVVQGVRDTYEIIEGGQLLDDINENKLVIIGKDLNDDDLLIELNNYLT